jgi:hypothetical protein
MNFNSVRGGIRRHGPFEEKLTEIFLKDILETPFPGKISSAIDDT